MPEKSIHRSARPSKRAQVLAFLAICIAGASGGLIGYAYQNIQCDEDCGISIGFFTLLGSAVASIGVAIIVVLILRAMEEWQSGKKKI